MSSSTPKKKTKRVRKKCRAPKCPNQAFVDGLCPTHHFHLKETGSLHIPRKRSFLDPRESFKTPKAPAKKKPKKIPRSLDEKLQEEFGFTLELKTARVFLPLLEAKRYKGAHGGRGSGKSHFFAELLIERCVMHPHTRAVCIREVQLSLKESVKLLIEDKINELKVNKHFLVWKTHIEVLDVDGTPRGKIIFKGMQDYTADSIKSLEGYDVAWVEEAQSLSETSWSLLRPTIRKEGSEIWCSWNPNSPKDPVDAFFRKDGGQENSVCVEANWEDNPWFPDILRKDMEYDRRRDPDRWAHVWGGQYLKLSSARVFRNFRIGTMEEFHRREVMLATPRYGSDWGYAQDPTVGVKIKIVGRTLYVCAEVYKVGCEIDHSPALFDQLDGGQARKWPIIADSARPETISYMKRNGYPLMRSAKKGHGSVVEGVEFLKSYDIVIHPDCVHTYEEFQYYAYEVDKHTQEVLPTLEDKKNHVIDAVRYACEAVRNPAKAGALFK